MKKNIIYVGLGISITLNLVLLILLRYTSSVDLYFSFIELFKAIISPIVTLLCFIFAYFIWHKQKQKEVFALEAKNLYIALSQFENLLRNLENIISNAQQGSIDNIISSMNIVLNDFKVIDRQYDLCTNLFKDQQLTQIRKNLVECADNLKKHRASNGSAIFSYNTLNREKQNFKKSCRIKEFNDSIKHTKCILIKHIAYEK